MELAAGNAAGASEAVATVVAVTRPSIVPSFASLPLIILAQAQMHLGQLAEAAAFLDEAAELAGRGNLTWIHGRVARIRSELRSGEGEVATAESLAHEALALAREAGDQLGLVDALELLARIAAEQDSSADISCACDSSSAS